MLACLPQSIIRMVHATGLFIDMLGCGASGHLLENSPLLVLPSLHAFVQGLNEAQESAGLVTEMQAREL